MAVFFYLVLNPSIRLSWITKHWERRYIVRAETMIREMVSSFNSYTLCRR
jgi:hypothetical protein